jgi:hypothetical protein
VVFPVQRRASRIRCQQYGYEVRSAGVDGAFPTFGPLSWSCVGSAAAAPIVQAPPQFTASKN